MLKGVHPLQGVQNRSRRTGRNFDDIRSRGNARKDLHTYLLTYMQVLQPFLFLSLCFEYLCYTTLISVA